MIASFAAGILPVCIGMKNTVLMLCVGYCVGYAMMALTGAAGLLMAAFLINGLAKECTLNTCTVLGGSNSADRTRGMSIMHACNALGALICPFVIDLLAGNGADMPILAISGSGLALWCVFDGADLPGWTMDKAGGNRLQTSFLKTEDSG